MNRRLLSTVIALVFLLSLQVFVYSAESAPDLISAKDEVYSLIDSGRFSEASVLVDNLIAENSGEPDLPDTLFYLIQQCQTDYISDALVLCFA